MKNEAEVSKHFALRPQKRGGLLGKGGKGRKSEGSSARSNPEDRGGRGPPTEQ